MLIRYPIECPVWIFSRRTPEDNVSQQICIKTGIVKDFRQTITSKGQYLMYEVTLKDDIRTFSGEKLAFASGCPVYIKQEWINGTTDTEGQDLSATVTHCQKNATGTFYTVQFDKTFGEDKDVSCYGNNIDERFVEYREVSSAESSEFKAASQMEDLRIHEDITTHAVTPQPASEDEVPQSSKPKQHDTVKHKREHDDSLSDGEISKGVTESIPRKRRKVDPREAHLNKDNNVRVIKVPHWLHNDSITQQQSLFHHLIGLHSERNSVKIKRETNVSFHVDHRTKTMSIRLQSNEQDREKRDRDLSKATSMVKDILLDFRIEGRPKIKNDGSKFRLIHEYDLSRSPGMSTSRAVKHDYDKNLPWFSILELTSTERNGVKTFDSGFLHDNQLTQKIHVLGGCKHKVYGCDPLVCDLDFSCVFPCNLNLIR